MHQIRLNRGSRAADYVWVRRVLFLLAGAAAIFASYMAVVVGVAPADGLGSTTVASIALPALVSGLVMTAFIASEARHARSTTGRVHELQAQLARKEVEFTRSSSIDELTGLAARHHFEDIVELEFRRTARQGRPLSLLLIEVDDLAELGEHVGTFSKTYLLSEVGGMLHTALRVNDTGSRYSADTLAVLLPETDAAEATVVAERMRVLVAQREFMPQRRGGGVQLTVSQGIATVPSASVDSYQVLMTTAEQALAEARTSGRNQIRAIAPVAPTASAESETAPEQRAAG